MLLTETYALLKGLSCRKVDSARHPLVITNLPCRSDHARGFNCCLQCRSRDQAFAPSGTPAHTAIPYTLVMLEVIQAKQALIEALCREHRVAELAVFGSVLTPAFNAHSDLDFLVTFHDMPPAQRANAFFGLLFGLEDAFERKVDLLMRESIHNSYLRQEVFSTAQGLYAA
jgi:uncharacterized protein